MLGRRPSLPSHHPAPALDGLIEVFGAAGVKVSIVQGVGKVPVRRLGRQNMRGRDA